jgi:hypothetical protein
MKLWKPLVEFTVSAGKSHTAAEAISKMRTFTRLCQQYNVTLVDAYPDGTMLLRARPRKAAAFQRDHRVLSLIGAV